MISIALASFKEAYRKKFFHVVGTLTLIYLALFSIIIYFGGNNLKGLGTFQVFINVTSVVSVLGFYFSSMVISFLSILLSIGAVSTDIESSVAGTVLSKPIARSRYILGKLLGLSVLLLFYSALLYIGVCMVPLLSGICFIKYFGFKSLFIGFIHFVFEALVLLSLSLWGSVRFKTLTNGIFVICIYILGLVGGVMEQLGVVLKSTKLVNIGIVASLISPFDSIYRKMTASIFGSIDVKNIFLGPSFLSGSMSTPSNWMIVYTLFYAAALIFLAITKFNKKDL